MTFVGMSNKSAPTQFDMARYFDPVDAACPIDRVRRCESCKHNFYTNSVAIYCGQCDPEWWNQYHEARAKARGGEQLP